MLLNKNKINTIIELAEKYTESIKEINNKDSIESLDKVKPIDLKNPKRVSLIKYLNKLNIDEIKEMTAIMWIGRDEINPNKNCFNNAKEEAINMGKKEQIIEYLLSKRWLDKYIQNGISRLNNIK